MELKAFKVVKEVISPKKFLNLNSNEKSNISSSRIVPPKIGSSDFGHIEVKYRTPVYKVKNGQ